MSEQKRADMAVAAWRAELRAGSAQTAGFAVNPAWFVFLDETGVDMPVTPGYAPGDGAPSAAVGQASRKRFAFRRDRWHDGGGCHDRAGVPGANPAGFAWSS